MIHNKIISFLHCLLFVSEVKYLYIQVHKVVKHKIQSPFYRTVIFLNSKYRTKNIGGITYG